MSRDSLKRLLLVTIGQAPDTLLSLLSPRRLAVFFSFLENRMCGIINSEGICMRQPTLSSSSGTRNSLQLAGLLSAWIVKLPPRRNTASNASGELLPRHKSLPKRSEIIAHCTSMREPFRSFRLQLRLARDRATLGLDPNDISISRFDCLEEATPGRMNNHHLGLQRIPFNF
jgi:hypothetical protein